MRYISILILLSLIACADPGNDTYSGNSSGTSTTIVFDKLVGTWQNKDDQSFERWNKNDDGSFISVAFSVKGTDTTWMEEIRVYRENQKWVSENKVNGQNNGQAIKFTESMLTENSFSFSNPEHDFPTDIQYEVVDGNTLHAFIAGPGKTGGRDTIPFYYVRVH